MPGYPNTFTMSNVYTFDLEFPKNIKNEPHIMATLMNLQEFVEKVWAVLHVLAVFIYSSIYMYCMPFTDAASIHAQESS